MWVLFIERLMVCVMVCGVVIFVELILMMVCELLMVLKWLRKLVGVMMKFFV